MLDARARSARGARRFAGFPTCLTRGGRWLPSALANFEIFLKSRDSRRRIFCDEGDPRVQVCFVFSKEDAMNGLSGMARGVRGKKMSSV